MVTYTQKIETKLTYKEAFNLCLSSLETIGALIKRKDESIGTIDARTGVGLKSFGEEVFISINNGYNGKTNIEVSSESIIRYTIFDWGKNKKNVKMIIDFLQQH